MLTFFAPPPSRPVSGSPAYLESIQRQFTQDASSGLIEAAPSPDELIVLLYHEGRAFAAYLVEAQNSRPIGHSDIFKRWPGEDIPIRSIELSSQAVRLAWQVLEWHPAGEKNRTVCHDLAHCLEKIQVDQIEGLVQVTFAGLDGYITFVDGSPVISETIFAGLSGIEEGLVRIRQLALGKGDAPIELRLYSPRPQTASCDTFHMRQAMYGWVTNLISRYQRVVGENLVKTLNYEVNTLLRLKRVNMRLVGNALIDNQLVADSNQAAQIYQGLLQDILAQVRQVIGEELAVRALNESYERLKDNYKKLLEPYDLPTSARAGKTQNGV